MGRMPEHRPGPGRGRDRHRRRRRGREGRRSWSQMKCSGRDRGTRRGKKCRTIRQSAIVGASNLAIFFRSLGRTTDRKESERDVIGSNDVVVAWVRVEVGRP